MEIPQSMQADLGEWNNGQGISLEGWIDCVGSFELAIGYCTIFWPSFSYVGGYVVREGLTPEYLNGWAKYEGATRQSVERVVNHLHLVDIHVNEHLIKTISIDKLLIIGEVLKETYTAKLKLQFPEYPCEVELFIPECKEDIEQYQLSFFQVGGDKIPAHQIALL